MSKHSSGPWEVRSEYGTLCIRPANEKQAGYTIGYAPIAKVVGDKRIGQQLENARLIAAAPDLLAALQDVDALWMHNSIAHGDGKISPLHEKVIAAIAKATGEQL